MEWAPEGPGGPGQADGEFASDLGAAQSREGNSAGLPAVGSGIVPPDRQAAARSWASRSILPITRSSPPPVFLSAWLTASLCQRGGRLNSPRCRAAIDDWRDFRLCTDRTPLRYCRPKGSPVGIKPEACDIGRRQVAVVLSLSLERFLALLADKREDEDQQQEQGRYQQRQTDTTFDEDRWVAA